MSESHREGRLAQPPIGVGPDVTPYRRHVRKVKEWKVFSLRLSEKFKATSTYFQEFSLRQKEERG